MSKRWALRLLLAVMLLAAFSAAVSADEGDGWYDASQEEYFWQDQQEVVFPDVTPEHWSYDDVMYLYRNGIIGGFPDGTFRPEAPITRQEMATMLYRYWKLRGGKYTAKDDVLAGYQDRGEVADWALEAMSWTVQSGIIVGMTPTTLNPAGSATRAQVALVLVNYLKMN